MSIINDLIFLVTKVGCGNVTGIPMKVPEVTNDIVNIIQVAVPVILVIFGGIDLLKGITAGKEDEIKKGQAILIKRIIVGALVFFLIAGVKFIVSLVNNSTNSNNIASCIDCFLVDVKECKK